MKWTLEEAQEQILEDLDGYDMDPADPECVTEIFPAEEELP